jgi:hypothetical protein
MSADLTKMRQTSKEAIPTEKKTNKESYELPSSKPKWGQKTIVVKWAPQQFVWVGWSG